VTVTDSNTTTSTLAADLGRLVDGAVLGPGDPGFDQARTGWNVKVDQQVAAVVLAEDAADMASVVRYARRHGLSVAAQPRGHGATPALNDTILLRTSRMQGIEVDPARRTARVEAGVRWVHLLPETAKHGLTGLLGSSTDPSVVGFTVGGGLSWFSRAYGFAANAVRAFEVLDADGAPARVTAETDPDLFWALRGGGGDYALITAMEIGLVPAGQLYGGSIMWPVEAAPAVLDAYRQVTATAPVELSTWYTLLNLPPIEALPPFLRGRSVVAVQLTYLGELADAAALVAPLTRVPGALVSALRPLPVAELDAVAQEPTDPMPSSEYSLLMPRLDDALAASLMDVAGPGSGNPYVSVQLRHIGGALRTPGPDAGPAGAIDEEYNFTAIAVPVPPLAAALAAHGPKLAAAMEPHSTGRKLFNFLNADEPASLAFDAATVGRLRAVKAARDPYGVFRSNRPLGV
jgi:hypothetical protein